jgi:hypothetical protein
MKPMLAELLAVSLLFAAAGHSQTYTTSFPLTENPISEGGKWINGGTVGLDWTNVSTTPGLAIGHEAGIVDYTDGTALLSGEWGPDQSAMATVYSINQNDACYEEIELRLRSSLSAHSCTGYEISEKCSKTSGAYLIIVRWNGPLGDFTYLRQLNGPAYGVKSGDSVRATIIGNVITAYINGVPMAQATDTTFKTGSPGVGFNLHGCTGTNGDYGFTKFTATGSAPTDIQSGDPEMPHECTLYQNYPNPFNPATTIEYAVPKAGYVWLDVYNLIGQQVATLFRGEQEAGHHNIRFYASSLASGIYFYRIRAGEFNQTRKLLLNK